MKLYKNTILPVSGLTPYAKNSRTHSEDQVRQICDSIKEFGFTNPVLIDEDSNIIAGHGRILAANKLAIEEVPCIVLDGLTEIQKRAYVIADNNIALNSGWDYNLLKLELEHINDEGFDIEVTGFTEFDIEALSFFDDNGDDIEFGNDDTSDRPDINTKKNVSIEFKPEDFQEAHKLISDLKNKGCYVGGIILNTLRSNKAG